jgi:hypothetical protein
VEVPTFRLALIAIPALSRAHHRTFAISAEWRSQEVTDCYIDGNHAYIGHQHRPHGTSILAPASNAF